VGGRSAGWERKSSLTGLINLIVSKGNTDVLLWEVGAGWIWMGKGALFLSHVMVLLHNQCFYVFNVTLLM